MRLRLLPLLVVLTAAAPAPVEPVAPAVTVVAARHGTIAEQVVVTGNFVPREEVLVTPQVDGLAIIAIETEQGDRVRQGQVLARLQSDTLRAQMAQVAAQISRAAAATDQAKGAIAEAQANLTEAEAAFTRSRTLLASGSTSRETYDQRLAASQTATARLDAAQNAQRAAQADEALAQAQRRETQLKLDRTDIRAPVGGIVSRRTARIGSVVGQAGDPLFRIIAWGAVELEGLVPEAELARLHVDQTAIVAAPGRDAPLHGRVRLVSPEVDSATRLGRVRLAVETDQPPAIGGFGRGTIEVARHDGVLVPLSAVLFEPEGTRLQVVRDGVVQTRAVTLGLRSAGLAEIAKGLDTGEQVVAVSGTFVRDGDRVAPVLATPGGSG